MDYQSQNSFLNRFNEKHIRVNWGTLLIGLRGPGNLPSCLTEKDVRSWALEKYLNDNDTEAASLAFEEQIDQYELRIRLAELSRNINLLREEEKWELLLLEDWLAELPDDPVQGLTRLTEFWSSFSFPVYSPHIVQGRYNKLLPCEYYTENNYRKILEKHYKWLEEMHVKLKKLP